jgi:hypothetical protein
LHGGGWRLLVIEDSKEGVRGARRAGMKCLAVTNSHSAELLGEATAVVNSLEQAPVLNVPVANRWEDNAATGGCHRSCSPVLDFCFYNGGKAAIRQYQALF